ncbi:MAG: hypothetical protein ABJR05_14595 [Balneola sp.]
MSDPEYSIPEYLQKEFQYLQEGADFDRMGPLLVEILKHRAEVAISDADLKDSFDLVIKYRLNDGKVDEALAYFVRSFAVDGIEDQQRLKYAELLYSFLDENEDHLVRLDYVEIIKHLRRQINYLEVYTDNKSLIAILQNIEARLRYKQSTSADRVEGPLREFVGDLMNQYYQHLPDEEACDYSTQIILESK